MVYAPIIIPTLNRKDHLQRCIASLQNNPLAKKTTLIIAVDYPPTEKYKAGYEDVCKYLRKGITGFERVEIIFHKKNLGSYENYRFLKEYVGEKWDRFIFTEDDNEMSPNFLEYINKGLEQFKENQDIVAICSNGVKKEKESSQENVVISHNFSAHGYGTWIDREEIFAKKINKKYLLDIAGDLKKMRKLYKYDPSLIFACQAALLRKEKIYQLSDGSIPIIDMTIKIYTVLENKYVICPCLQKSRNWGYDGSGENCPVEEFETAAIIIDERYDFEYQSGKAIRESTIEPSYTIEVRVRAFVAMIKLLILKILVTEK